MTCALSRPEDCLEKRPVAVMFFASGPFGNGDLVKRQLSVFRGHEQVPHLIISDTNSFNAKSTLEKLSREFPVFLSCLKTGRIVWVIVHKEDTQLCDHARQMVTALGEMGIKVCVGLVNGGAKARRRFESLCDTVLFSPPSESEEKRI